MENFPALTFEDGVSGRRATLRSGPDVWEIVSVWREYDPDRQAFHAHFEPFVDADSLDEALAYAARFPEEIQAAIEENLRVERDLTGQ